MTKTEQRKLLDILNTELESRQQMTEAKLVRPIVPIEQWVNSTYYLGPDVDRIYPFWKKKKDC